MSWASRRRTFYGFGTFLFLLVVIGGPVAYHFLTIPATCTDGKQNQGETAIDRGGPCPLLDPHALNPSSVMWARSFRVRDGVYNSVAYIQNPNDNAGVRSAPYRFSYYDADNILIGERTGTTYLMPGTITPVFEGAVDTGQRAVAHTQFEFTEPLTWERLQNTADVIEINDREISGVDTAPRITASARNGSVKDMQNIGFVAVVFDPAGNAFTASQTVLPSLPGGGSAPIVFTWPDPFNISLGSVDITPISAPIAPR
ncbi:MAG: hypothetical protein JO019_05070 [Candidatus Kaiserbacteria bacterium]|nr:hypothetical protein [Candidatus Kaiserbacteria bacterium]